VSLSTISQNRWARRIAVRNRNLINNAGETSAFPHVALRIASTGLIVTFPEEHWFPMIPSFGVSYEF
jgi:hypothetical protein